ncbi:transcriptional regulator, TetR family [Aliiroseovarius halocynthiae]|nr:TetR/AcrR family transcriptional regulator [Aliiroseovarius halocynthiae]SMR81685.1 transcriptional regulator, TetR family [Aliiroseovarius halocynthiae]
MRDAKRQKRHEEITAAAYDVMGERGYEGASMLNIAKAAKASNETLYRWYGDKNGLFEAMVRDNTAQVKEMLTQAVDQRDKPIAILEAVAPVLLKMLLGERAVKLNRAAAADISGELGAAISKGGREVVIPLLADIISELDVAGPLKEEALVTMFLSLLIGDLQIKRVTGVMPAPTDADIDARCALALRAFRKLI